MELTTLVARTVTQLYIQQFYLRISERESSREFRANLQKQGLLTLNQVNLSYIYTRSVPRSKHTPPRLYKPVS